MCGLAGVIFGERQRSAHELRQLTHLFTRLLVISQQRGRHATGIAWLNRDRGYRLLKRPLPAEDFVEHKLFADALSAIDSRTTVLLGHTRWRTRGNELVNSNNHPIRAVDVIGTHNGTIYNADELFEQFRLYRHTQVDSEVLFRIASTTVGHRGRINVRRLLASLQDCRGQLTAVMASRRAPETIEILKGNNPLECRWHPHMRVVIYASSTSYLDTVLASESGWHGLILPPMRSFTFQTDRLSLPESRPFRFDATSDHLPGKPRRVNWRQSTFDDR
jgi:amidophosphoribosyltransferase